jgi:DNA-dependent protein kinase catalytic subunit
MDMLTHRESSLQLVCLKMVHELLSSQSEDELNRLIAVICSFITHPYVACRYQMLLILIAVFEAYQFKNDTATTFSIKTQTNGTLLKALLDEDQTIRLMAQNFWTEKANMPSNTIDRMVLILEKMYSPQTESEYLSYSTNLLLEKTSKSPDYNRLIYEQPLSQCIFKEYNLTADWRRRHEMMTPLFVETVNSMNNNMSSQEGGSNNFQQLALTQSLNPGNMYLRATVQQSLQFQPTQEQAGRSAYNWLTQSSVDTLQASISSSLSDTQSALLFSSSKRQFRSANNQADSSSLLNSDQDILKLRKRFMKDKTVAQNRFFARKQVLFTKFINLIRIL